MRKFKLLQRITVVAGAAIFLLSVVTSFMEYGYASLLQIPEEKAGYRVELWSFRYFCETFGFRYGEFEHSKIELWFFDFWLRFLDASWISKICAALFVFQTLTLLMALTFIFMDKKLLIVLSTITCPISTALMIYVFTYLSQIRYFSGNYRVGYWLTYPSEALFIISALLQRKFDGKIKRH